MLEFVSQGSHQCPMTNDYKEHELYGDPSFTQGQRARRTQDWCFDFGNALRKESSFKYVLNKF
jgi:hypothetical protein